MAMASRVYTDEGQANAIKGMTFRVVKVGVAPVAPPVAPPVVPQVVQPRDDFVAKAEQMFNDMVAEWLANVELPQGIGDKKDRYLYHLGEVAKKLRPQVVDLLVQVQQDVEDANGTEGESKTCLLDKPAAWVEGQNVLFENEWLMPGGRWKTLRFPAKILRVYGTCVTVVITASNEESILAGTQAEAGKCLGRDVSRLGVGQGRVVAFLDPDAKHEVTAPPPLPEPGESLRALTPEEETKVERDVEEWKQDDPDRTPEEIARERDYNIKTQLEEKKGEWEHAAGQWSCSINADDMDEEDQEELLDLSPEEAEAARTGKAREAFEAALFVDQPVEVRWVDEGFVYRALGRVDAWGEKHIRVLLSVDVLDRMGLVVFQAGDPVTVPKTDMGDLALSNPFLGVFPPPTERQLSLVGVSPVSVMQEKPQGLVVECPKSNINEEGRQELKRDSSLLVNLRSGILAVQRHRIQYPESQVGSLWGPHLATLYNRYVHGEVSPQPGRPWSTVIAGAVQGSGEAMSAEKTQAGG
jgi:hypothetical protein